MKENKKSACQHLRKKRTYKKINKKCHNYCEIQNILEKNNKILKKYDIINI